MTTAPEHASADWPVTVISIGTSCQSAWQARHYTNVPKASYFDWLVAPTERMIDFLGRGTARWRLHDIEPCHHVNAVQDRETGLFYPHDFLDENRQAMVTPDKLAAAREKYSYLAERFSVDMASDRMTIFVWQNVQKDLRLYLHSGETLDDLFGMSDGQRARLTRTLAALRQGRPFALLTVTLGAQSLREVEPGVFAASVPERGEHWYGDCASWATVYDGLRAALAAG